jgi:choline dehydrogenase-like flavoprotein
MHRVLSLLAFALPLHAISPGTSAFDYIIVGGGPAGLVLASKLSVNPNITVALIEAGDAEFNNPNVTRVDAYALGLNTTIDWSYTSAPQKYLNDKTFVYYSGKGLGGTTMINGMTYLRAEKEQIDAWGALGNEGWDWEELYPYYRDQEHFQVPDEEKRMNGATYEQAVHGLDGNVAVGWSAMFMKGGVFDMLKRTTENMGLHWNKDANSGRMSGFSTWPLTLNSTTNTRHDAARAYYYPIVASRPNLYTYLNTTATRILWSDTPAQNGDLVASGIEIMSSTTTTSDCKETLSASGEILLAAGSLRSPALLEHSGVGNAAVLEPIGISTALNLPSVGAGLQDQPNMAISYVSPTNWTGYPSFVTFLTAADLFGSDLSAITAELRANTTTYAQLIVSDSPENETTLAIEEALLTLQTDLVFSANSTVPLAELLWAPSDGAITCVFWTLLPFSKGSVHITSPSFPQQPAINPNFLQLPIDTLIQAAAAVKIREYFATAPLSANVTDEVVPSFSVVPKDAKWRDDAWANWIKEKYEVNHHPVSSASMRSREYGGVVDAKGKVYGTKNVRVADAAIFPMQISGHLSASVYAVAGKIADAVLSGRERR